MDVTDFIKNDFMATIYKSFFRESGITTQWSFNPIKLSYTTRSDKSPEKDYKIESLYPLLSKALFAILHLPRSLLMNSISIESVKEKMLGPKTSIEPSMTLN